MISVNGPLSLHFNNQLISLYLTIDGVLRFISNQAPSANSYFKKAKFKSISTSNHSISLEVESVSKVLEINNSNFIIKNRKTKKTLTIPSLKEDLTKDGIQYKTTFSFEIQVSELLDLLDNVNLKSYDATVLDTFSTLLFYTLKQRVDTIK